MYNRKTLKEYFLHFDMDKLCFVISIIAFTLIYISVLRFILSTGISLLNSDVSSEMVLSEQLNREKAFLFTKNWFYGNEIRVLNTMPIFRVSLVIFPNNWHYARLLSVALLLLILAGSMIWLMCSIGQNKYAFWAAITAIAPFGRWYGWNVIFNSYYVPHIVISILSLALVCSIVRNNKKWYSSKKILLTLFLFTLGFMAGLGGVRQLMICYVPLFAVSIILLSLKAKQILPFTFPAKNIFVICSLLCLFSSIGFLVNTTYLSAHYHLFSFDNTTWKNFDLTDYFSRISDFISLFGWQEDVPIFSLAGISNVLSLLLIAAILFSIIYLITKIRLLGENELLGFLFFCIVFLVDLLIYGGTEQYNESYWITILPFAFIPLFIMLSKIVPPPSSIRKTALLCSYGLLILLFSYNTMRSPYVHSLNAPVPTDEAIQGASAWLNETDYTQGIATFWNSNILTELSNGKIEMWTTEYGDRNLTPKPLLQSVEHETLPQGKVFVLLTLSEFEQWHLWDLENYIIYMDDEFIIYGFDDISQYFETISEL